MRFVFLLYRCLRQCETGLICELTEFQIKPFTNAEDANRRLGASKTIRLILQNARHGLSASTFVAFRIYGFGTFTLQLAKPNA